MPPPANPRGDAARKRFHPADPGPDTQAKLTDEDIKDIDQLRFDAGKDSAIKLNAFRDRNPTTYQAMTNAFYASSPTKARQVERSKSARPKPPTPVKSQRSPKRVSSEHHLRSHGQKETEGYRRLRRIDGSFEGKVKHTSYDDATQVTTMTQFIEAAASPPPEPRPSAGRPSNNELKLVPDNYKTESKPTERARIEDRTEKTLQRMLGQRVSLTPEMPGFADSESDKAPVIQVNDFRPVSPSRDLYPKSPKKKFLGWSIPSFRSSAATQFVAKENNATPPADAPTAVPLKAGKVLGPPFADQTKSKTTQRSMQPRSTTTQSLPQKLKAETRLKAAGQSSAKATASVKSSESTIGGASRSRSQSANSFIAGDPPIAAVADPKALHYYNDRAPPTPPTKDTPPQPKLSRAGTVKDEHGRPTLAAPKVSGMAHLRHKRNNSTPEVSLTEDFMRPGKVGAVDYIDLIHKSPSNYSMRGELVNELSQASQNTAYYDPALPFRDSERPDPQQRRARQGLLAGARLPPTVYSPSVYSTPFAAARNVSNPSYNLFTVRAPPNVHPDQKPIIDECSITSQTIPVTFQGNVSEVRSHPHVTFAEATNSLDIHTGHSLQVEDNHNQDTPIHLPVDNSNTFCSPVRNVSNNAMRLGEFDSPVRSRNGAVRNDFVTMPKKPELQNSPVGEAPLQNADKADVTATPTRNKPLLNDKPHETPRAFHPPFTPDFPSAVPPPLNPFARIQSPLYAQGDQIGLPDGSDMLTHFGVVNHHMDMVAEKFLSAIEEARLQSAERMDKHHEEQVNLLNAHVEGLLREVQSISENCNRAESEIENLRTKSGQLFSVIQKELTEPFRKLLADNNGLTKEVGDLRQKHDDLHKKFDKLEALMKSQQQEQQKLQQQQQQQQAVAAQNATKRGNASPSPGNGPFWRDNSGAAIPTSMNYNPDNIRGYQMHMPPAVKGPDRRAFFAEPGRIIAADPTVMASAAQHPAYRAAAPPAGQFAYGDVFGYSGFGGYSGHPYAVPAGNAGGHTPHVQQQGHQGQQGQQGTSGQGQNGQHSATQDSGSEPQNAFY